MICNILQFRTSWHGGEFSDVTVVISLLQPFSLTSAPPKWLAELEKDDMDMLQGI